MQVRFGFRVRGRADSLDKVWFGQGVIWWDARGGVNSGIKSGIEHARLKWQKLERRVQGMGVAQGMVEGVGGFEGTNGSRGTGV